jgi:catechol 2,3-dioxygenase-like lactoylglutathione lyase family enzyme
MKRFHVHVRVADLAASERFYSRLFGQEPSRREADYAKWMLDDPRLNFAISTRGEGAGVDHLGFQVDDASELAQLQQRGEQAGMAVQRQGEVSCCYARSEKHWVTDPQGVAWEHFHTLGDVPVYGDGTRAGDSKSCCGAPAQAALPSKTRAACC